MEAGHPSKAPCWSTRTGTTSTAPVCSKGIGGQTQTGADGVFQLDGIAPDTVLTVQAVSDAGSSNVVTVSVGPGMVQTGIVLTID